MIIITIGIDLPRNGFAVRGVDESSKRTLVLPTIKPLAKLAERTSSMNLTHYVFNSFSRRSYLG